VCRPAIWRRGPCAAKANVSLRPAERRRWAPKVEIKNLNSFRASSWPSDYEIARQTRVLDGGGRVRQVTMGWGRAAIEGGQTVEQRLKEESEDYRYFPEPDLPPLRISGDWVQEMRGSLPELPDTRQDRFIRAYGLPGPTPGCWLPTRTCRLFRRSGRGRQGEGGRCKTIGNWLSGELFRWLRSENAEIGDLRVGPQAWSICWRCRAGNDYGSSGRAVLDEMLATGRRRPGSSRRGAWPRSASRKPWPAVVTGSLPPIQTW